MKTYDVICPVCGHKNYSLYLEETEGWMECEHCNTVTKPLSKQTSIRIPKITMSSLKLKPVASI